MVKPVKLVDKVEGKEKIQNVAILFEEQEWTGKDDFDPEGKFVFMTETFIDVAGYQVNGDLAAVIKRDGGQVVIPMRRIRSIETSFIDKE